MFAGGFLGLDNIGVFDRGQMIAGEQSVEQADATAWMAFYCLTMLDMALELAREDPTYEDAATKFLYHFTQIADSMNNLGGTGLWDERRRVLLRPGRHRRAMRADEDSLDGRPAAAGGCQRAGR